MKGRLSLDALRYIDGELDAVVAERSHRSGAVNGRTTVAAENPRVAKQAMRVSFALLGDGTTYVAVLCTLVGRECIGTGVSRSIVTWSRWRDSRLVSKERKTKRLLCELKFRAGLQVK